MAPTSFVDAVATISSLGKRQNYVCNGYNNCYYQNSSWYSWGRWVAIVCIILFVLFLALLFSCLNARRRRRAGTQPMYGTGWLAGKTPHGHNGPSYTGYNNNQQKYAPPAPPYSAQPVYNHNTGNTFNSNDGYYGQQSGIELQQPQQAYGVQREEPIYNAPNGPPPKKHDGIIR